MSVRAVRVESFFDSIAGRQPGAFSYYTESSGRRAGVVARCPCGCGALMTLPLRPVEGSGASWDGPGRNPDFPTLSPSVNSPRERGLCGWHGWLRNGIWYSVDESPTSAASGATGSW